jgi:hypothetical protein
MPSLDSEWLLLPLLVSAIDRARSQRGEASCIGHRWLYIDQRKNDRYGILLSADESPRSKDGEKVSKIY